MRIVLTALMAISLLAQSAGLSAFVWCFCEHGVTLEAPSLSACHCESASATESADSSHVESECGCTEIPAAHHAALLASMPASHHVAVPVAQALPAFGQLPTVRAAPRPALVAHATAQFLARHTTVQLTI